MFKEILKYKDLLFMLTLRDIKTILKFAPKVDFEDGLRRTVDYFSTMYGRVFR